jgi:hypothetical protein
MLPSMPGELGRARFFCSIRCAVARALEPLIVGEYRWCEQHESWENDDDQQLCERLRRREQEDLAETVK